MGALALVTEQAAPAVVRIRVEARDPLLRAGVESCLRGQPGLMLAGDSGVGTVAVVVTEVADDEAVRVVSAARRAGQPVLLVTTSIDEQAGAAAIRAGVGGVLLRRDATADRLLSAIRTVADGYGVVPPELLGGATAQPSTSDIGDDCASSTRDTLVLDEREKNVLRLLADGHETVEVARRLAYSVRTVTGVVHGITRRLCLRNRAHAVAFALREGLI